MATKKPDGKLVHNDSELIDVSSMELTRKLLLDWTNKATAKNFSFDMESMVKHIICTLIKEVINRDIISIRIC